MTTQSKPRAAAGLPFSTLLRRYGLPHLKWIVGLALMTTAANVMTVAQPAILAGLVATLSDAPSQPSATGSSLDLNSLGDRMIAWLGPESDGATALVFFCGLFVALAILAALANYLADYGAAWLRLRMSGEIRFDLIRRILEQDLAFFHASRGGELAARVTRDATMTAHGLGPLVRAVLHHGIQLTVYGLYLVSTSVWLTVVSGLLLLTHFVLTQLLKKPTRRAVKLEMDATATMNGALHEAFTNIRVTKSFGAEAYQLRTLRETVDFVEQSLLERSAIEKLEPHGRSVVDAVALIGIFLIAVSELRRGALTLEGLLLFMYIGKAMFVPINGLATAALWAHSISSAFERVGQLLAMSPTMADGPLVASTFEREIEVRDVTFSHGSQRVLSDISLTIRKGQVVAFVGHSGAGKSTLGDLILRLYDPDSGVIRIDGLDLRTLRRTEYRRLFGVVSQEPLLLHQSVRENIRYGREYLCDADIARAARLANVEAFVSRLPLGYDTVVGERGITLSGGERQRVALARALAHSPQILLLDEATSALDSQSERDVQLALESVLDGVTAIVIAHRLSTIRRADQIFVLRDGRIEAAGRHDALLASSETYADLHRLQFETTVPQI